MQSVSGEEQVGVRRVTLQASLDGLGGLGWREGRGGVFGGVRAVEKNQCLG